MKLGKLVSNIRSGYSYSDKRAELEPLGITYKVRCALFGLYIYIYTRTTLCLALMSLAPIYCLALHFPRYFISHVLIYSLETLYLTHISTTCVPI